MGQRGKTVTALLIVAVGAGMLAPRTVVWMNRIPNCTPAGERWVWFFCGMTLTLSCGLAFLLVIGFYSRQRSLIPSGVAGVISLVCMLVPMFGWLIAEYALAVTAGLYGGAAAQACVDTWREKGNPKTLWRTSALGMLGCILCVYLALFFVKSVALCWHMD